MSTKTCPDWNQLIWREHRLEPAMDEIISDPIIQALMRRDGVTRADIRRLMDAARLSRAIVRRTAREPARQTA